jgi:hypothetical protein
MVTLSDASKKTLRKLTVGASNVTVFAGLNGPGPTNAVGIQQRRRLRPCPL